MIQKHPQNRRQNVISKNGSFHCDACGRFFSGEDEKATHDFRNLWDYHAETVIEDYTDYCGPCVATSAPSEQA